MKKLKNFFCLLLIVWLILSGCSNHKSFLQNDMKVYLDNNYKENETIISISDFTNFKWDTLLIFQYPVSAQDIENAIGVKYDASLDLIAGMIFVQNGKIVYDEIFEDVYSGFAPFQIYPYEDINAELHYNVFTPKTSSFRCEKVISKESYGYRLYPVNTVDN